MYSNLAPRLGHSSYTAYAIGTTDLRGGKINWGSLGSSISNAFRTTGRFLSNTASRFAKSDTFSDIKKGFSDSGIAKNVATLAGESLNSLVDIGRLKLGDELLKLRRKVLANDMTSDQLAQILLNYQQTHDKITVPEDEPIPVSTSAPPDEESIPAVSTAVVPAVATPGEIVTGYDSRKRPYVEEEVITPEVMTEPTSLLPFKRRIRGTGEAEWQRQLNSMLGQGVRFTSSNYCY